MKRLLIPLLVVAGLGLILAGMMRGPVAQQRRLTSCQSNLKRIGLAMMQYARDYDEKFPIVAKWQDDLVPYHKSPEIMDCSEEGFNYSMNRYFSGVRMTRELDISNSPLYFDSTMEQKNASDSGTSWPFSGAHFRMMRPLSWRQTGGANVCYADGHVKWEQIKPQFKVVGPTVPPLPLVKKKTESANK